MPCQARPSEAILPQLKTLLLERLELGGGRDLANTCLDASAANRYPAGAAISLFARVLRLVSQFAHRVLERGALLDFDALAVVRQLGTASAAGVTAAAEKCIGRSDESHGEDSEDGSDACVHGVAKARNVGMARVAESVVGALGLTPLTQLPRFCSPFHSPSRRGAKTSRETPTKTISHLVFVLEQLERVGRQTAWND